MIRLVLTLWILMATPALAVTVAVKSGEHEGFTRLVLDFGTPLPWQVGRTLDGYELRLTDSHSFDLTEVFSTIGKGRLAAIWADPKGAVLRIGIACACHAIPFEFRPGILVIDLRDGAPPDGSSFEEALDNGLKAPALADKPVLRPRARPGVAPADYDWTSLAIANLQDNLIPVIAPVGSSLPSSDPTMQPLRDSLLRQLSRGAAQGVIDLALPEGAPKPSDSKAKFPAAQIALGELRGVTIGAGLPDHTDIAAQGEQCITAEVLDFASWGSDLPVAEQMSALTLGLIGEFDRPDPSALEKAIRLQLFLGFGAETRQLLRAFPSESPDVALWRSLSYIVDGEPDPTPAFSGQAACETPAALWSLLSDSPPTKGDAINRDAALLAFAALPLALRRHLGPRLAERFMALDDSGAAGTILSAIQRAPGDAGPDAALAEAKLEMANGDPVAAETHVEEIRTGPGSAEAMVALVMARVAQDRPVEAEVALALSALLVEQSGSDVEPDIRKALVLAQAGSGDFVSAFDGLPLAPEAAPDLWRLLAKIGADDAVLAHAVLLRDQPPPQLPQEITVLLAERLMGLGMTEAALPWLASVEGHLRAQALLERRDAKGALLALTGLDDPAAELLRANALHLLGDDDAAALAFAAAGDAEGERRAKAKARDWKGLELLQASDWATVATALHSPAENGDAGPLTKGHQLVARSSQTRLAVTGLLANVAVP